MRSDFDILAVIRGDIDIFAAVIRSDIDIFAIVIRSDIETFFAGCSQFGGNISITENIIKTFLSTHHY